MKFTNKDLNALPLSIKLKVDLSMKYIFTLLILFNTMIAFSQTEEVIEDSIPVIENVVIYKDARLDLLDKRPPLMAKLEMEEKAKAEKAMTNYKPIVSASGKKKVTGSIYTTKGYRIIIYNGSDRALAMEAKNKFSKTFSSQRSYISYNVPSYKIKVGDFEDKKDATVFLRRVSSVFPSSFIVPDIITVKNINVTE
jgi:SPOR domain